MNDDDNIPFKTYAELGTGSYGEADIADVENGYFDGAKSVPASFADDGSDPDDVIAPDFQPFRGGFLPRSMYLE